MLKHLKIKTWILAALLILCTPSFLMEVNAAGISLIKVAEGYSDIPYICPAGKITIGYGHTATANTKAKITEEEAEKLLKQDLTKVQEAIKQSVTVKLNENQFSALVSFVYNVGIGAFKKSTLRKLINKGEFELAASEFDKWVHAGGRKLKGLVERRKAEKELFLTKGKEYA